MFLFTSYESDRQVKGDFLKLLKANTQVDAGTLSVLQSA
jgi:hypothetical protein